MAGSVYGLWLARRKEAFYHLSQEEQAAMMSKRNENLAQVGGKDLPGYQAYSSEWEMFGIVEYPSAEAQQEHELFCDSLDWKRYFDMKIVCGIKMPEQT